MNPTRPIKIAGFGKYLPKAISSAELEHKYNLPAGWSENFSGVVSRHQVSFESNGFMGARAIENALQNCSLKLTDLDLIISASATFDYPLPNSASVIKSELAGALDTQIAGIDIDSSCLSFVSAFEMASGLMDGNQYKRVVIVSSEISSIASNPANWETFTLLGDAAVAVILEYDESYGSQFIKGGQKTYSEGVYETIIKGGGNKYFFKDHSYHPELHSFFMNGIKVLRIASKRIPEFMEWFFKDLPFKIEEVDAVIPHQASRTGINLFKRMYMFKEGQVKESIAHYGNCIAASIPLTLYDAVEKGEIKRGDLCLLCGTSAGFAVGAVLIRY